MTNEKITLNVETGKVKYDAVNKIINTEAKFSRDVRVETAPEDGKKLLSKPLGQEYVGEDKEVGWRQKAWNLPEEEKTSSKYSTHYYTEKEKEKSEISVDSKGRVSQGWEKLDEKQGFVMDPTTGKMHLFTPETIVDSSGDVQFTHHSSPLAGGDVAGAGHITGKKGIVKEIDDASGHYKPDAKLTHQVVKTLQDQGVKLIDDTITDQDGDKLDSTEIWEKDTKRRKAEKELAKLERKALLELPRTKEIDESLSDLEYDIEKQMEKIAKHRVS